MVVVLLLLLLLVQVAMSLVSVNAARLSSWMWDSEAMRQQQQYLVDSHTSVSLTTPTSDTKRLEVRSRRHLDLQHCHRRPRVFLH